MEAQTRFEDQDSSSAASGARHVPVLENLHDPVEHLKEHAWQRHPMMFRGSWLDTSEVSFDIDDLGSFIQTLPKNRVYVRATKDVPGASPEMSELSDAPLSEQLAERKLHITTLDLQHNDPTFARIVRRFEAEMTPVLKDVRPEETQAVLGLFIASGSSVVPYHVDFEHNFLIQVCGSKTMHLFPGDDPEIFSEASREQLAKDMSYGRHIPYEDRFEERAEVMRIEEGVSTYQPPLRPHFVKSDDEITVSLLLSLYTSEEVDRRMAYIANRTMRKFGLSPRPVGNAPKADRLKSTVMRGARDALRVLKPVRTVRGRKVDVRKKS